MGTKAAFSTPETDRNSGRVEEGEVREISGVFVINDLSKRVSRLEDSAQEISRFIGKTEESFNMFPSIGEDIKEIKGDVKGVVANQGQIYLQLVTFDNRVKHLEEDKACALQKHEERKKAARTAILSVAATVIGAAIIWIFGLK